MHLDGGDRSALEGAPWLYDCFCVVKRPDGEGIHDESVEMGMG